MTKCDECKFNILELSDSLGIQFPEGTCYYRRDLPPGNCQFPPPTLDGIFFQIFRLFQDTYGSTVVHPMGMDPGLEVGRDLKSVQSLAESRDIPWCETVTDNFLKIQAIWLQGVIKQRKKKK